jgi:hypothetical protein
MIILNKCFKICYGLKVMLGLSIHFIKADLEIKNLLLLALKQQGKSPELHSLYALDKDIPKTCFNSCGVKKSGKSEILVVAAILSPLKYKI